MRRLRSPLAVAVLAVLGAGASGGTAGAVTPVSFCPSKTVDGVRVVRLTNELGCSDGLELAVRTVKGQGYHRSRTMQCRWGQAGARPVRISGHRYYPGFCADRRRDREFTFYARRVARRP